MDHILQNLSFAKDYIADLPKLRKICVDGGLASEVVQYVDDLRTVANSAERSWMVSMQMAKVLCYLGLQNAARKRRRSSRHPGAWAGCILASKEGKPPTVLVTQERWCKLRTKIRWIAKQLGHVDSFTPPFFTDISVKFDSKSKDSIHFKTTEKLVGFIVYVCQTYKSLMPYLKGIYLTLNSWCYNRDAKGWLTEEGLITARNGTKKKDGKPPQWVKVVPCLHLDILALMTLTAYDKPPELLLRAENSDPVFIVGDSSGLGFGSVCWIQGHSQIHAECGRWKREVTDESSSNFREGCNLVIRLKRLTIEGKIKKGFRNFHSY